MKTALRFGAVIGALLPAAVHAQSSYAEAFARSTDLREFVDRRAASPKDGSFFYSYWARWECYDDGGVARRVAKEAPPAKGSEQFAAVQRELHRCRNMPRELSNGALQRDDVASGRAAGDKLFSQFRGKAGSWFQVEDQAALQRALKLLSVDTDPNMVWVLAQKIAGLGASRRIALKGERLSEADGRSLYVAFLLGACDVNVDCGKSHRWMRSWCVQNGECSDLNLEAYWQRLDSSRQDKMDWKSIATYRALVTSAAASRDWSAFSLLASMER